MDPTRTRFPRCRRLRDADSYSRVFKRPNRSVDDLFTILWRHNSLERARLGTAIAKKNIRRSVDRNLIKRIVRESFRYNQALLAGIDIVVLSRRGLPPGDRQRIRASLDRHWQRVARELKNRR